MYILDTDHVGILQRRTAPEHQALWTKITAHPQSAFSISIISFHEQVLGWNVYINRARDQGGIIRAYAMFERILADFACAQILSYDQKASAAFESLKSQRIRVATMDLRIAASEH